MHKLKTIEVKRQILYASFGSIPFRSGGVAAAFSPNGKELGERIGMEWVFDKSFFISFQYFFI